MITAKLIINLFLILSTAWILGLAFSRYGLPAMLGELLAGVILGPPLLGIVSSSPGLEILAELGIFFVMFHTGMELNPKELLENMWPSLSVAIGGFILPFTLGYLAAWLFGGTVYQSLFVGMGVSITAIAVQAVILHSMKIHHSSIGHIIIGAAIADDILSLMALSVLLGLAETGSVAFKPMLWIVLKVVAFFGFTITVGHYVMPKITRRLTNRGEKAFTFAIVTALVMAFLAEQAGLHLIIGAFLAGQFVRKEIMDDRVFKIINDRFLGISYGFLVPIFFATLSFHLHVPTDATFIGFAAVLILVAVMGKLVGCGLGAAAFKYNFYESVIIGFGMNGRGAVELVVAMVVIKYSDTLLADGTINAPLLTQSQFSALVLMAFVTTLMAPLTLRWMVNRTCLPDEKADFCRLMDESER
ncbi:MAG: cation:proton antiporter [Deltaproteobacteria bacterium]|jgi:Kef-type K+ transport system membrane component KefB|nr:cation:proton antiporter [Deltaproteobacteria bacterium]